MVKMICKTRGVWRDTVKLVRSEDGSVTIEFVLWIPFFALLLAFVTDATLLYTTVSTMHDAARDAARRVAINQMTTSEAEAWVESSSTFGGVPYAADAIIDNNTDVVVQVSADINDVAMFGIFSPVTGDTITTVVTMRQEPAF